MKLRFFLIVFGLFIGLNVKAQPGIIFTTLCVFGGTNGTYPYACVIQAKDGNFYGTTSQGGEYGDGTVFEMPPGGTAITLVSFGGTNGIVPEAGVIQGTDGNLYGTTQAGGSDNDGTVFSVTTNGVFNFVASFDGSDGYNIIAGLVQGSDGNFYGTAIDGGVDPHAGTVFQVTPSGNINNLYSFNPSPQVHGASPQAGLVEGMDGTFYGTTADTIFHINTNGVLTNLFYFNSANVPYPTVPMVLGADGDYYGMTRAAGTNNLGTVFQVTTNGVLTSMVSFNGTNGANAYPFAPTYGPLVLATDGNFYGTTPSGGSNNIGTIFMMTPNGILTTLYSFIGGTNGGNPTGLMQAQDGNFYGTTTLTDESPEGSGFGNGTIFKISIPLQPAFKSVTQTNNTLGFNWSAVAGRTYQLQFTTDLASANWQNLGGVITATNGCVDASDFISPGAQRFYRVVLVQ